jgi:hypothetical protein
MKLRPITSPTLAVYMCNIDNKKDFEIFRIMLLFGKNYSNLILGNM